MKISMSISRDDNYYEYYYEQDHTYHHVGSIIRIITYASSYGIHQVRLTIRIVRCD
jgi:hypothetical protein